MSEYSIELDGRSVAFTLRRSARRTIGFTISRDGLAVAAPRRASEREIRRALVTKSGWILSKLDDWVARPVAPELVLESGASLPWLGSELTLDLRGEGVRTTVRREGDRLILKHDPHLHGELRTRTLTKALQRFYKREGDALMAPKVAAYAARLGRPVRKVIVRDQKRRWGSCASDATIRLNWRLMGFPEALIDYVCAHEAAHLVEANHSPAYWRVVESLMPDWKPRRQQMRDEADRWVVF
ncbi:SprT family zinc-dependent metalloprotease [Maricaulis sp.]|jgi:predicted metal-dependent hydrolase|uniref:M48 family metallopeptidase n=1 Tax=Maricaulis sp. TaxID=1486257 RepID=UPI0026091B48|nr:SprT family zinc-dependent metalloprotease [Maricaulis sp.]MDF1768211.1 SprT family zinc-dependent metalloprotease [Maricaulis sp.]